jgi:Lon protease-like protein
MTRIDSLPLFPLADVVLLPEVSVPLVLFEPRYRQMIKDVLAGGNQIGMVTVRPDCVGEMAGDPLTFDVGCLGRVTRAEHQPDGTTQILLKGVSRFRILEEDARLPDRLYRSADVELLDDESPTEPDAVALLERWREELFTLLERLVQSLDRPGVGKQAVAAYGKLEAAPLINSLTQSIAFQPVERQRLLESDSIVSRFEIMGDLLRFRLAEIASGDPGAGSLPH